MPCNLCDTTGFVPIYHKTTNVESVVTCICDKGEKINRNNRERKEYPFAILSYKNIDWDNYSLMPVDRYSHIAQCTDPELKQILDAFLEKVGPKKEVNND